MSKSHAVFFLAALVGISIPALGQSANSAPASRYLRLVEEDDGRLLSLEVAARTLVPANGVGPEILLAAAIHIAQPSFYRDLQSTLDERDIVIFERVKPAGMGDPAHDLEVPDDLSRARVTGHRLRAVAVLLEGHFDRHGRYPAGMEELAEQLPLDEATLLDVALVDAWGRPVQLVITSPTRRGKFDLFSLGADGRDGGVGVAADMFFSDQEPITPAESGAAAGIQKQLADAMGLVFQLDAMDHSGAQWFNGDLSVDQIEARLGTSQGPGELFGFLSGESMMARASGALLRFVGSTDAGSSTLRLLGIELLSRADLLLEAAAPALGDLFGVLIQGRNEVVVSELRGIVSAERERARETGGDSLGGVARVGVIYGAAHMRDLERRVCDELGYVVQSNRWVSAVEVDVEEIGIPLRQVGWIRGSIQKALDLQLGQ